ncbi:Glypican-1 [Liparis tanakae]|uniref:Glypican-1 n=1 Tax=Liparis tanakae TaxID=230148 RepID=A0A4Z2EEC4_9TELE|nr:Glypican-1 [Liparis tanakae]
MEFNQFFFPSAPPLFPPPPSPPPPPPSPPPAYFTELHLRSERSLQEVLSPLGALYSQNTRLYGDLYADLRQYYRGSALNLDETLSEFWSRLLERTFKSSAPTEVSRGTFFLWIYTF